MHLLYLDESGDPYSWDVYNTFVLAGVAVFEGELNKTVSCLDEIQKQFFPEIHVPLNFHADHIRNRRGRFREMSECRRSQLLHSIYATISEAKRPGLVCFATVVDISWARPGRDACIGAFTEICRIFNLFLMKQFQSGHPSKGILIIDPSGREDRYRQCVTDLRVHGASWGHIGNIVDVPYFAQSKETRMVQLADFCAHAVYLNYERNRSEFFDMIQPRFARDENGGVYGLSHLTG